MNMTIEQRMAAGGFLGLRGMHFVNCRIEFSEAEKAAIRARDLESFRIVGDLWDELSRHKKPSAGFDWIELLATWLAGLGLFGTLTGICILLVSLVSRAIGLSFLFWARLECGSR